MMKKYKFKVAVCLMAIILCIPLLTVPAFAIGEDPEPLPAPAEYIEETEEQVPEDSGIVTRDLLYDEATNKQFISIQDREGNVFYLIIDYDAPVDEDEEQYKVYFLNPVDSEDLSALTGEKSTPAVCTCKERCRVGAVETDCKVCAKDMTRCIGKVQKPAEPVETQPPQNVQQPETPEDKGMNQAGIILLLAITGLIVFGGIKLMKGKPKEAKASDMEFYEYEDDEDEELELYDEDDDT